jgi:hypothetical protein
LMAEHTSIDMSKKLGYKFDKYKRWLNNEKILKWDEFIQLANATQLNLNEALSIFKTNTTDVFTNEQIFSYLKEFNLFKTNQDVADYLKCHISVVKRYSKGITIPDVETIFRLIDYNSNYLSAFLNKLFPQKISNPLLNKWIEVGAKPASFESSLPLSSMIEAALYLDHYKEKTISTELWLAEILCFDVETIKEALKKMLEYEVLAFDGKDHYYPTNKTTNLNGLTLQDIIPFIQFLNLRFVDLLEKRKNPEFQMQATPGAMVYRVFPASNESMAKINIILFKANNEILKALEEDPNPKSEARALLLQTFSITK